MIVIPLVYVLTWKKEKWKIISSEAELTVAKPSRETVASEKTNGSGKKEKGIRKEEARSNVEYF